MSAPLFDDFVGPCFTQLLVDPRIPQDHVGDLFIPKADVRVGERLHYIVAGQKIVFLFHSEADVGDQRDRSEAHHVGTGKGILIPRISIGTAGSVIDAAADPMTAEPGARRTRAWTIRGSGASAAAESGSSSDSSEADAMAEATSSC